MTFTPYPNEVYTTFSFLGFIMCMIPFAWHLKAWNAGTCLHMFWAGIECLIFCINSIVWHGNTFNPAPIWCDISTRITIGAFIGIPASALCINRRLYLLQLNPTRNVGITKSDKMRALAVDLGISVGIPILSMILEYIPQGHRFNIFEDIGCFPSIYNTWVAVVITDVPSVLVGVVSSIYAIRTIISINKRRKESNELLFRRLNVTSNLYFRLMCLAGIQALLTILMGGFFVICDLTLVPLFSWVSWKDTHSNFDLVNQYPAIIWHNIPGARMIEFTRWMCIICSILFFSLFGFAQEARFHYCLIIKFFVKFLGIRNGRPAEVLTFHTAPLSPSDPIV